MADIDKRLAESIERLRIWADQYKVRPFGEEVPMIVVMAPQASDVAALIAAFEGQAEELRDVSESNDLYYAAADRARALWKEAHGEDAKWSPGTSHLIVWMGEQLAAKDARIEEMEDQFEDFITDVLLVATHRGEPDHKHIKTMEEMEARLGAICQESPWHDLEAKVSERIDASIAADASLAAKDTKIAELRQCLENLEGRIETRRATIAAQKAKIEEHLKDYMQCVEKFDDCRSSLARIVDVFGKDRDGYGMPDDDKRAWHEWLIEVAEKRCKSAVASLAAADALRDAVEHWASFMRYLEKSMETNCSCDPSVGMAPCVTCQEKSMVVDLFKKVAAYSATRPEKAGEGEKT